jgi:hypothetical protein
MVLLLTATLLWGGCLSCAQYFMSPVAVAGHCCKPSGECRKAPNSSSPAKDCAIQAFALAQTVVTPDHAAVLLASAVAAPDSVPVLTPSQIHAIPDLKAAGSRGSPPDLNLLHSVFRV